MFRQSSTKNKLFQMAVNVSRGQNGDYLVLLPLTNRPNFVIDRRFYLPCLMIFNKCYMFIILCVKIFVAKIMKYT